MLRSETSLNLLSGASITRSPMMPPSGTTCMPLLVDVMSETRVKFDCRKDGESEVPWMYRCHNYLFEGDTSRNAQPVKADERWGKCVLAVEF